MPSKYEWFMTLFLGLFKFWQNIVNDIPSPENWKYKQRRDPTTRKEKNLLGNIFINQICGYPIVKEHFSGTAKDYPLSVCIPPTLSNSRLYITLFAILSVWVYNVGGRNADKICNINDMANSSRPQRQETKEVGLHLLRFFTWFNGDYPVASLLRLKLPRSCSWETLGTDWTRQYSLAYFRVPQKFDESSTTTPKKTLVLTLPLGMH